MSTPPDRSGARWKRAPEPERRPAGLRVRLTSEEHEELRTAAEAAGVSMSRLLIDGALGGGGAVRDRERLLTKLNRLERLVGNMANNVNQLAHQANIAGQVPELGRLDVSLGDLAEVREEIRTVREELR